MFRRLLSLIVLATFLQSGTTILGLRECRNRPCPAWLKAMSRYSFSGSVRPISIFPEEAKRFSESGRTQR